MRAYKKYRKEIIQDTTEEKKEENTEPKEKLIYSNYDSEGLARIVDGILEYRDKYCFEHLLKGCEKGFLTEDEYAHINKWVNKDTGKALIRVLLIWGIITPLCVFDGWNGCIGSAVVWGILLFLCWAGVDHYLFGPERVRIGWYDFGEIPVWEDREDHRNHLLDAPAFIGYAKLRAARKAGINKQERLTMDNLLIAAQALSYMRCLSIYSEEIKAIAEPIDMSDITIEVAEEDGCNEQEKNGEYKITLVGKTWVAEDMITPVEERVDKTFFLPYVIGKDMVRKFRTDGVLDFTILEYTFPKVQHILENYKNEDGESFV